MTTRPPEFQTSDIDITAAIMTVRGNAPAIYQHPGRTLVTFEFPDDDITRGIIVAYASGELVLPVKRFAGCRAWLYRQAKGGRL